MATPTVTVTDNTVTATWEDEGGTGGTVRIPEFSDKTVMAHGTGTVAVDGSMDGTNWGSVRDHSNTAITALAVDDPRIILENPTYLRVVVSTGTATVTIVGTRAA